jgi:hypothetical protein
MALPPVAQGQGHGIQIEQGRDRLVLLHHFQGGPSDGSTAWSLLE